MPELPEVETIKRGLNRYLVGHKIVGVDIRYPKIFVGNPRDIEDGKIKNVRRFAKVLSIDLDNGYSVLAQIKLTGQLIYRGPNLKETNISKKVFGGLGGKHTHVIIRLDKGAVLYYNDVRKFGRLKVIKTNEVTTSGFVEKLGPEPFLDLTLEIFKSIVSKNKTPIKLILMDQEKIGGVGNIYANDALWLAKIHPKRPANSLSPLEQTKLFKSVEEVLKKGIETGGASELSYVTADGTEGKYQEHFLAYGRGGKSCERCHKAKVEKIKLGGRGTYFCPNCQKL